MEGWRPAHRCCPHLFLAGIWPPLTSLWALRLQWDRILKRGCELPADELFTSSVINTLNLHSSSVKWGSWDVPQRSVTRSE